MKTVAKWLLIIPFQGVLSHVGVSWDRWEWWAIVVIVGIRIALEDL